MYNILYNIYYIMYNIHVYYIIYILYFYIMEIESLTQFIKKILEYFSRNSSLYEYEVPDLPELVLKEKLEQFSLMAETIYVDYKFLGMDFFYIPEVNVSRMVKNLDIGETNRLLLNILHLNTPIEKCRITSVENDVDFKIIESSMLS